MAATMGRSWLKLAASQLETSFARRLLLRRGNATAPSGTSGPQATASSAGAPAAAAPKSKFGIVFGSLSLAGLVGTAAYIGDGPALIL